MGEEADKVLGHDPRGGLILKSHLDKMGKFSPSHYRNRKDKPVKVQWPDCGDYDYYTAAEFRRHAGSFSDATEIWVDGKKIR